ncbi:aspartate aminotransferase family protein [Pelistega sp. MC2]|uniref:aminotransferase family protein n=1 Tax=Pelistega sp. MC2 TaxID=1720297 RepID=UPI0008DB1E96|nr:aminotransferase class III-fold pyridoxal phosphate-dependent enzyme [Pelistega sp. MC2]
MKAWCHGNMDAYTQSAKVTSAKGVHVQIDKSTFIDCVAGILGVTQIGYGNIVLVKEMSRSAQNLSFFPLVDGFYTDPSILLAEKLNELTPFIHGNSYSYFLNSGSEAIDTAMKMAVQFHRNIGHPTKRRFLYVEGSYHGSTIGATSICGITAMEEVYRGLLPDNIKISKPSILESDLSNAELDQWFQNLLDIIHLEGSHNIAALIIDAITVSGGVNILNIYFWSKLQDICKEYDILLIIDEVFTGFGRTGRWFASEIWNISPDILVLSKGISSGYFPISATVATERIRAAFGQGNEKKFIHGGTYSGHPVGCAVALKNIQLLTDLNVVEKGKQIEQYFLELKKRLSKVFFLQNITVVGAMISMEIICPNYDMINKLSTKLKHLFWKERLLVRIVNNIIYIHPALIIQEKDIVEVINRFLFCISQINGDEYVT